jgi:tripartite ATP-independent transporter DctM subunit
VLILSIVVLLLVLLMLGMPIAFALGVSGAVGILSAVGFDGMLTQLSTTAYRGVAESTLAAIPLFVFMAELMGQGGMARRVFNAANKWMGWLPGGVGIASVLASAGFAAVSGSSTAASGTLAAISLPEFKRLGYGLPAATGIVATAGTLAVMIPPSIAMIIYGIMTQTSIGKLLIAGVVPGILTAILYVVGIYFWARRQPHVLPRGDPAPWPERWGSLRSIGGFLFIVLTVFVSLYAGIATATETAAVAAGVTLVFLVLARRLGVRGIYAAMARTVRISAMMLSIVVGALIFGYFLTITRATPELVEMISRSRLEPWMVFALVVLLYLILGVMMDQIAILLITLPVTFPLITSLGYDPIWFGVIIVKLVEIGLITPPVGMNVFVVSGATGVPVAQVFRGTGYMLLFEFVTLAILMAFPFLSTALPALMLR